MLHLCINTSLIYLTTVHHCMMPCGNQFDSSCIATTHHDYFAHCIFFTQPVFSFGTDTKTKKKKCFGGYLDSYMSSIGTQPDIISAEEETGLRVARSRIFLLKI